MGGLTMARYTIISDRGIGTETEKKIVDILRESECPNESLANSIDGFTKMEGHTIKIGLNPVCRLEIEV